MKKIKLIATLLTICLAICTLAYGVYAATNLSFGISANVAFTVDNLFVKADAFVYNIYNQDGTTPQGSAITTSIGEKTGLASLAIIDNSDGQSIITANNIAWTIPANQPLYFNSSDLTKKIIFRVEVANYTPNKDIRVTIAPANGIEATLTSLGITGTATSGTAVALNGTAQKAIATYELEVEDLTTPISSTTISLNVTIAELVPTRSLSFNVVELNEDWNGSYGLSGTITYGDNITRTYNIVNNTAVMNDIPNDITSITVNYTASYIRYESEYISTASFHFSDYQFNSIKTTELRNVDGTLRSASDSFTFALSENNNQNIINVSINGREIW